MSLILPLLCIEEEYPFCYFIEDLQEFEYCTLSFYYKLQRKPQLYFDPSGRKFRRKLKLKRSFGKWQKLLSYIYWGKVSVESIWCLAGEYEIDELKNWIVRSVEADDDILTQFIDADHLIRLIEQSRHFEDIYMVLQDAIYNYDDDDSLIE